MGKTGIMLQVRGCEVTNSVWHIVGTQQAAAVILFVTFILNAPVLFIFDIVHFKLLGIHYVLITTFTFMFKFSLLPVYFLLRQLQLFVFL